MEQKSLFENSPQQPAQFKNCIRCGIRCRIAKGNPNAQIFKYGDRRTGKFCVNCLVVDFFKNFDMGPSSALGKEYFDSSLPQPGWRNEVGDKDIRFSPDSLRLPHIQQQLTSIFMAAHREYQAEIIAPEIDWDEVIANWHLPFPEKPARRK